MNVISVWGDGWVIQGNLTFDTSQKCFFCQRKERYFYLDYTYMRK